MHSDLELPTKFQPTLWPIKEIEIVEVALDSEANASGPAAGRG